MAGLFGTAATTAPHGALTGGAAPSLGAAVGYRSDIDGLRGIAVLAVLLFHAGLTTASGGFVGVDVFFVISGYLITQILVRELDQDRFSIARFYERRIKRIFPALLVLVVACAVVGYFVFLPDDYRVLGRNAVSTALFSSNVVFWMSTGYFDGPAQYRSLLHTWSLAVEEQFYIFFPPLLAMLWPLGLARVRIIVAALAAASLAASAIALSLYPTGGAAFYLTPFRAWELLLGSLLAIGVAPRLAKRWMREVAAGLGLVLIAVAVLTYSELTPFPGLAALVPCLGAALIICAGRDEQPLVGRLLSLRPLVFVGLISYSLYLWHWPIFVFARYLVIDKLTTLDAVALVVVCFAVATLSWRFVELPWRRRSGVADRIPTFTGGALGSAAVIAIGAMVYLADGLPNRFAASVTQLSGYAMSQNPEADRCADVALQLAPASPCTIGEPAAANRFLFGDSHAGALYGGLDMLAKAGGATVYGATPRCPPLLGVGTDQACIEGNAKRLRYVLDHPEIRTVVVAARWALYFEGRALDAGPAETNGYLPTLQDESGRVFEPFSDEARQAFALGLHRSVRSLLAAGKKVVLVYPVPELGYDIPSTMARLVARGENPDRLSLPISRYHERNRQSLAVLDGLGSDPNLVRVYPSTTFCPEGRCMASHDGTPLYFDSHHLSIEGSKFLIDGIRGPLSGAAAPRSAGKQGDRRAANG